MNTSTLKHNYQSPSRSKSKNKNTTSPKKGPGSPSAQQKRPKTSDQAISSKMKTTRQKLCSTLDAYILILETNAPLRCLQHNSVLSLYCETQQKLLCANCVYRSNNHKLHRVFPIQKCYKQIARDVDQMSRQVERQILWADNAAKSIIEYFKDQQKHTNQALMNVAQMYDQIQFQLSKAFDQTKRKLVAAMDTIFSKKQSLLLQLQFFNHIYTKNKPINVEALKNTDASVSQYHLIFNHLVGYALIEYGKLEGNKIHDGISKIKNLEKHQMAKLNQIKALVESWKTQQKDKQYSYKHLLNQKI